METANKRLKSQRQVLKCQAEIQRSTTHITSDQKGKQRLINQSSDQTNRTSHGRSKACKSKDQRTRVEKLFWIILEMFCNNTGVDIIEFIGSIIRLDYVNIMKSKLIIF